MTASDDGWGLAWPDGWDPIDGWQINLAEPLDRPIAITFFPNFAAATKAEETLTPRALAHRIAMTSARSKAELPWLKLSKFGDSRTEKGSLRSDENLLAVTGIEADYDGEVMPFDAAAGLLEKQGVTAIIYASPSHADAAPRWRVLCPFSEELAPDRRSPMLGRLNGLFRGIFSPESWTLSQSYYFGAVAHNPAHRVEMIDGLPIDQHDDLDAIWTGKTSAAAGSPSEDGKDLREDAELVRRIATGEGFHTELVAFAARLIGRGIPADTTGGILRGLMLSHPDAARDERWDDRYGSIGAIVRGAVTKYAEGADARRAVARLTHRLADANRAPDEIQSAVEAEAEHQNLPTEVALKVADRVLRDRAEAATNG